VVRTVTETVAPALPAPAQPVVQPITTEAVPTVDQLCGLLGGCP
jgi:hypothetical protein